MEISHVIEIFHFHHARMPSQVVNENVHLPDEADIAFQRLWWIFTKCRNANPSPTYFTLEGRHLFLVLLTSITSLQLILHIIYTTFNNFACQL
jgi:hypothetical protein